MKQTAKKDDEEHSKLYVCANIGEKYTLHTTFVFVLHYTTYDVEKSTHIANKVYIT